MPVIDLYKDHKDEYIAPPNPVLVTVKPAKYLTISGEGAPGGEEFQKKVGALYSVAYTIKFARKRAGGQDYKVPGFEGLWWTKSGRFDWHTMKPSEWRWKLIMRVPEFVSEQDLEEATTVLRQKGKPPEVSEVTLETIDEGKAVQMLHVGPYDAEKPTVEKMEAFAQEMGLTFHQAHHEIYLSDPRRVKPEKLRTILRHPVK